MIWVEVLFFNVGLSVSCFNISMILKGYIMFFSKVYLLGVKMVKKIVFGWDLVIIML